MQWTKQLLDEVRQLKRTYTFNDIAEILTAREKTLFTDDQVRGAYRRDAAKTVNTERRLATAPKKRTFDSPLELECTSVTVIADLHAPYHNQAMLERVVDASVRHGSDTLVIAGDLFNFDSVTAWPVTNERESLQDELQVAGSVLVDLSQHFTRIVIVNGNHDERLSRRLDAHVRLEDLVNMALARRQTNCEIFVTDYDYVRASVAGQPWLFGHLSGYSKRPGELAKRIAERHLCNVAVGHDHLQGFTSTSDGEYLCISTGAMVATDERGKSPFWYKERRLNDYSDVKNGFLIVETGIPWLYNERGLSALNGGLPWSRLTP